MSGHKFQAFAGVIPRTSNRLIDIRNASTADNLQAFSGKLRSWHRPLFIANASKRLQGEIKSIYRIQDGAGTDYWLNWLTDVDVVPGPLAGDETQRLYFTGDGSPKKTNLSMATAGTDYPASSYEMGVPTPGAPTATVSTAGSAPNQQRTYGVTFVNAWDEEGPMGAVSAAVTFGATGFTIAISGIDTGSKSVAITRSGSTATAVCANHGFRNGSRPTINGASQAEYNGTFTITVVDANTFTYQVSGAPATPATGTPVAIGNYALTKRRLYRSVVGASGLTGWQLVTELADLTTTTYNDTTLDSALGVVCPTFDPQSIGSSWLEPPEQMVGMIGLQNNGAAGFYRNVLCFAEPNFFHAWPVRYQLAFKHQIVGIKAFGASIVVATTGKPCLVTGSHPDNMSVTEIEDYREPCTSKRGMADGPAGVYYPSPNGVVEGGLSGFQNVTRLYFTGGVLGQWKQQCYPDTMIGAVYDGRYYGFFSDGAGTGRGVILPAAGDAPGVLFHTQYVTAVWVDPGTERMYIVQNGNINEWDADENNLIPFDWWSKVVSEPNPINFGAWKVDADFSELSDDAARAAAAAADAAYNAALFASGILEGELNAVELNGHELNGSLMRGGATAYDPRYLMLQFWAQNDDGELELMFEASVTSKDLDRAPSGFKSDVWQFRLTGNIPVEALYVAEIPKQLNNL